VETSAVGEAEYVGRPDEDGRLVTIVFAPRWGRELVDPIVARRIVPMARISAEFILPPFSDPPPTKAHVESARLDA
jgi:hypothetical protein